MRRQDIEELRLKENQWMEIETASGKKRTQFLGVTDTVLRTVDGLIQLSNVRAVFLA